MNYNEDYRENQKKVLKRILEACLWERVGVDLYKKAGSRIFVDEIGIFLYRRLGGTWVRTEGRSHNLITSQMLRDRMIRFQDFKINLMTGK